MLFNELWSEQDFHDKRPTCILDRVTPEGLCADEPFYQISLEEGLFSGHPTIDLTRKQLEGLGRAIEKELNPERLLPRCGVCQTLLEAGGRIPGIYFCPEGHGEVYRGTDSDRRRGGSDQ